MELGASCFNLENWNNRNQSLNSVLQILQLEFVELENIVLRRGS